MVKKEEKGVMKKKWDKEEKLKGVRAGKINCPFLWLSWDPQSLLCLI